MSIYGSLITESKIISKKNSYSITDKKINNISIIVHEHAYKEGDICIVLDMLDLDFPVIEKELENHFNNDFIKYMNENLIEKFDPEDLKKEYKLIEASYGYILYLNKTSKEHHGLFEFTYEIPKNSKLYGKVPAMVVAIEVHKHKESKIESIYELY